MKSKYRNPPKPCISTKTSISHSNTRDLDYHLARNIQYVISIFPAVRVKLNAMHSLPVEISKHAVRISPEKYGHNFVKRYNYRNQNVICLTTDAHTVLCMRAQTMTLRTQRLVMSWQKHDDGISLPVEVDQTNNVIHLKAG
ncbi:hypothetical protein HI914_05323 [Erysiphe necator]|nr:hypothetical protein HI914_05323 [Erysiphe necator]